jgi:competence CoiA-like predicted nuclease
MSILQLGALDINTNIYTPPYKAIKSSKYKCIECNEKVIFKKGAKRKPYFSHYAEKVCYYYDNPSESQKHKDAKLLLYELLNEKKILILIVYVMKKIQLQYYMMIIVKQKQNIKI